MLRARLRTAAGVFAAAMGASLLVTGFIMIESMDYLVDFQFFRVARSDVDLTFSQERGDDALVEVRHLPGVDHAEPVLNVACTFVHGPCRRKAAVTGLLPDARLTTPRDVRGRRIRLPTAGLVLTRRLANILRAAPGEIITIIPTKGERRPVEVAVASIADSYMGLEAYADISYLSRAVGEEFALSGAQLSTDHDPRTLARLYDELKRIPGVESVVSRRRIIEKMHEALLENQYISIGVLIGFAGVVFFGSVVNASIINLAERQREVATYLAMGYTEWRVGALFLRESLLTNSLGSLLGLPIGYFLMWLTVLFYNNDILRLPLVTAPWVWAATLAVALLFTLAAHVVVQVSIYRMDCLTALKVKE
jgi:putative ABC transport system permease protein